MFDIQPFKLYISLIILTVFCGFCYAQEPVHNYGNLKIHTDGAVGFYHDFINDGITDENNGLAGFYSDDALTISGAFQPVFEDMEVVVANNLFLDVGVGITNNSNFILGNIVTPRNLVDTNLEYRNQAFYTGESVETKVDGYASINNQQNFIFPIGNSQRLRPLELSSNSSNNSAKSAYFEEDPNNSSTFSTSFNTDIRTDILLTVSTFEFWDLDGEIPSTVTLSWDTVSNLPSFIDELQNLRIVGWNTTDGIWEDLGNTDLTGDFDSGEITSEVFLPDSYSIITFGGSLSKESITLGDFYLSPNGDGINDFFELEAISLSPNNKLKIYNRWGRAVYEESNYRNLFNGQANVNSVFNKSKDLPAGVYFYIINLFDIDFTHQGYLYINQE